MNTEKTDESEHGYITKSKTSAANIILVKFEILLNLSSTQMESYLVVLLVCPNTVGGLIFIRFKQLKTYQSK